MARKSRKNIPEVVSSATVQNFNGNRRNLRKRNDRNPGGTDEKLCGRYGRHRSCRNI